MAIEREVFKKAWVQQNGAPNCGSCCMASIVNYARKIRKEKTMAKLDNTAYVGLTVSGVHSLGSVSARLAQWLTSTYPGGAFRVEQVKVDGESAHWGGVLNMLSGGDSHRQKIVPDAAYFRPHPHRFLLREFSVAVVAGHFIIQTGVDSFWDPNEPAWALPGDRNSIKNGYSLLGSRADALQIDVVPA